MKRNVIGSVAYCSIKNIKDVQNAVEEIECNLPQMNKSLLTKMLKGFVDISKIVGHQEVGIFKEVIRWCRLYLDMHISIDPKNTKLLEQFEKTAPTAVTYIIGYLQYKAKDVVNYHYNLLQIIASILQNLPQQILQYGFHFEPETMACLWKPIDLTGDFNVQLLTLQIFASLVKYLNDEKRNAVLNSFILNGMNLVRDKLNIVIQESALLSIFEERSRELLHNYNTYLWKNTKIQSFSCKNVSIGHTCDIYRPLNCDKLWIDLSLNSQLLTFKGRYRYGSEFKTQNIDVSLKVQEINLENGALCVHFDKSHSIASPVNIIDDNVQTLVKIHLSSSQLQSINDNPVLMSYIQKRSRGEDTEVNDLKANIEVHTFDKIRNEKPFNEVKKKPLNQISKSVGKCYKKCPFESSSPKNQNDELANFSTNQITCTFQQHNANAFDTLNTATASPVSRRLSKNHIKNHSILQLRSRKQVISNVEDYIPPNKHSKKDHKKYTSSSAKSSGRKRKQKNKQMPMKTPKEMNNMVSASERNINPIKVLRCDSQCDVSVQDSAGLNNEQCRVMGENVQNHHKHNNYKNINNALQNLHQNIEDNHINKSSLRSNKGCQAKYKSPYNKQHKVVEDSRNARLADSNASFSKISAANENSNSLETYKHINSEEFSLKSQSFKKPVKYAKNLRTSNQLSPKNDTAIDSNENTKNLSDCEELRCTKNDDQESICSLPKPTGDIGSSVIDLTLATPTTNFKEITKKELSEKHEFFGVPPSCWLQSGPVTPASSTRIMALSDINDSPSFGDFENETEEFHLVNQILNEWETDSDNNDKKHVKDLEKIKGLESILKTFAQNNVVVSIPIDKSKDFFAITKEYQSEAQLNLERLRKQYLSNASEIYKDKVSTIAEQILKESGEQRKELQLFQNKFKSSILQLQTQCAMYMNRSKLYQIFQENMESLLNSLGNNDLKMVMESEHNELTAQVSMAECDVRQRVWQTYLEDYRKNILNELKTIPNL